MPDFLADEMEDFISRMYGIEKNERIFTISKSYLHHEMDRGAKLAGGKENKNSWITSLTYFTTDKFRVFSIGNRRKGRT